MMEGYEKKPHFACRDGQQLFKNYVTGVPKYATKLEDLTGGADRESGFWSRLTGGADRESGLSPTITVRKYLAGECYHGEILMSLSPFCSSVGEFFGSFFESAFECLEPKNGQPVAGRRAHSTRIRTLAAKHRVRS